MSTSTLEDIAEDIRERLPRLAERRMELVKELVEIDDEHRRLETALAIADDKDVVRSDGRKGGPRATVESAVLALLRTEQTPMTATEVAETLGIRSHYLYTLLPRLEECGQVSRLSRGRGRSMEWVAVG